MPFPQFSEVSLSLEKRQNQVTNEKVITHGT